MVCAIFTVHTDGGILSAVLTQSTDFYKRHFRHVTVELLKLFDTFLRNSTSGKPDVQYIYNLVSKGKVANIVYIRTINNMSVALPS